MTRKDLKLKMFAHICAEKMNRKVPNSGLGDGRFLKAKEVVFMGAFCYTRQKCSFVGVSTTTKGKCTAARLRQGDVEGSSMTCGTHQGDEVFGASFLRNSPFISSSFANPSIIEIVAEQ